jgi:hypothetical protein
MASKRRLRRKACDGKIRHSTEAAAMRHYARLRYGIGESNVKVYHCGFCGGWHIGHWKGTPA